MHEVEEELHGVQVVADDILVYDEVDTDSEAEADQDKKQTNFIGIV